MIFPLYSSSDPNGSPPVLPLTVKDPLQASRKPPRLPARPKLTSWHVGMDQRSTTASTTCTPTGVSYVEIGEGFIAHQTAAWTLTIPATRQGCDTSGGVEASRVLVCPWRVLETCMILSLMPSCFCYF
ncbi:hypothetical protein BDA96_07G227500 [Sorghum bicolor]|uniref:Uncharacterized protein n=1 Tax=Sorghum bicolor TaxID=4558 RepID=A0A921QM34_SORBI|nr:hypothetical protein BDA96_07G227500 [Sorghum bicolor]